LKIGVQCGLYNINLYKLQAKKLPDLAESLSPRQEFCSGKAPGALGK